MPNEVPTLAKRILAIIELVGAVKATGKSPFSGDPAQSIGDVEDALRPLLVHHGVVIRFKERQLTKADREWVAEVTACVDAVDLPGEGWYDDWADSGSTPAAAYSFARKSYMKALFHIADTEDHAPAKNGAKPVETPARQRGADARPKIKVVSRDPTGRVCPDDGGDLELVTWDNGHAAVCCVNWREKDGGCKHREMKEAADTSGDAIHDDTPIPF